MIIRSCYRARLAGLISNIGPAIDAAPAPGMIGQSDNADIRARVKYVSQFTQARRTIVNQRFAANYDFGE